MVLGNGVRAPDASTPGDLPSLLCSFNFALTVTRLLYNRSLHHYSVYAIPFLHSHTLLLKLNCAYTDRICLPGCG